LPPLVAPTIWFPKFRDVGFKLTGSVPKPMRAIVCGLLLALSLMFTVPVCAPAEVGAKVTVMVHWLLAGMVVPHVFT